MTDDYYTYLNIGKVTGQWSVIKLYGSEDNLKTIVENQLYKNLTIN